MKSQDAAELAQTLFEEIGDAAFVADPRTLRLLDVNPMSQRLTELPREKLLLLSLKELFRSDGDKGLAHLQRALHTTQTFHSQEGYFLRRGVNEVWIPVNLTLTRLHTDQGPLGLVLARDVTEQHQAKDKLRRAHAELERRVQERTADLARVNEALRREVEERKRAEESLTLFRALIDRMSDSVEVIDPESGRVLDVNEQACQSHGYTRAEYLSLTIPELDPTVSGPAAWAKKMEYLRQRGSLIHEGRHRRKDGSFFPVEVHVNYIHLDRAYVVAVVRDVTERKRAEEALRLRDRAIQAVTQGILITDATQPDNPIIYVSPGFERLTGYPPAEVLGRNCRFLQGPETDPEKVAQLREAIRAGGSCTVELLNYNKAGDPFWNELSISPVRDEQGRLMHFVGVQTEVTERRRLDEQYRQMQKMEAIGQLAGGVAHDFNNLLTVINGYSELLLAELPTADRRREPITAIREAGERAAGLTGQLLAFSRKAIVEPKVLDLNEVIDATGRMLRRLIGEDVTLTTVLSPGLSRIKIDPGQVEQVIINLAVNARDAMPRGGRLTIETADAEVRKDGRPGDPDLKPGRYVRLSVSDVGVGMTDEVRSRIFEPFFTTKSVGHGTGLGLATVYGIVNQAGGHIAADSQIGVGTTFTVLLPAVPEGTGTAAGPEEVRVAPRGSEAILLVEDEDGVRSLARLALEMQGYTVLEAGTGAEALRVAEAHAGPVHLVVTDVVMPDLGGRDLVEAVRARRPGVKVLYMSGYMDDAMVRHGVSEAADAFLQKPFTPFGLARKVRAVLDEPS